MKLQLQDIKDKEKELNQWAKTSSELFQQEYSRLISIQGRDDSMPPSLSPATHKIQNTFGKPDGSGIRDHLKINYGKDFEGNIIATVFIDDPKAQMIASVQEYGAIIPVTEKMRGKLALAGIFLRSDTTHIRIPGRYAWKKAYQNTIGKIKQNLKSALKSNYGR